MRRIDWKLTTTAALGGILLASLGCAEADQPSAATNLVAATNTAAGDLPPCCPADTDPAKAAHASHVVKAEGEAHDCEVCVTETETKDVDAPAATPLTQVAEAAPQPGQAAPASVASDWIAPEDRVAYYLDFDVENQDGASMNMTALRGKPVAMSFIFTRCPNPRMCPLIASTMAELQDILAARGLTDDVQLVLVTYDPTYDTPERLKAYGAKFGLAYTNAVMLRAQGATFREMLSEFSVIIGPGAGGLLNHRNELLLLDRDGRYVRDYRGDVWDAAAVADDLATLVTEAPLAQAQ